MPPIVLSFVHTKNPVVRGLMSVLLAFVSTGVAAALTMLIALLKSGTPIDLTAVEHVALAGGAAAALTAFQAFLTPAPGQHLVSTSTSTDTPPAAL